MGGGIGGLTATIALRQRGFEVQVVERDPSWSVYGVGIIQQANVVRAMSELGLLTSYVNAGFGFNHVDLYRWDGGHIGRLNTPKLVPGYPANLGITRPALHKVLGERASASGGAIRLGDTVSELEQTANGVHVRFSGGSEDTYDLVIGADGTYSSIRTLIFPGVAKPVFTGQSVWRYNLPRPAELDGIRSYHGPVGVGLVPLAPDLMYIFATTAEPGNPKFPVAGLALRMQERLAGAPPDISVWTPRITDDRAVVYRPLDSLFLSGPWHRGRVVLLGDAAHTTTPHLGQGAGLAVEDSLVLADELVRAKEPEQAFEAYRQRRFERCQFIVEKSLTICHSQQGTGRGVDQAEITRQMLELTAQPI